jgi:hypothetical protein
MTTSRRWLTLALVTLRGPTAAPRAASAVPVPEGA